MNDIIYAAYEQPDAAAHQHDCWELCLCLEGEGHCHFVGQAMSLAPGELIVIPAELEHQLSGSKFLTLQIQQASIVLRQPTTLQDDENQSIRHLMEDALWHFRREGAACMLLNGYGHLLVQHIHTRRSSAPHSQLVEDIARSIQQNFSNPLYELDETLRSAPYCYDYLCRLFRLELSTTPHKYLTDLRLQAAADALRSAQSSSMTEIARMCGYSDPLYFSRMFKKKYGLSPREYAKQK